MKSARRMCVCAFFGTHKNKNIYRAVKLHTKISNINDDESGSATTHLHEELCLDSARGLALPLRARRAQRVDLVDKDDRRLGFARHLEHLLDQLLGLALPLRDEVRRGHGEERAVSLGGHGLGEEGLSRAGGTVQQDAFPGLALAGEELWGEDRQNEVKYRLRIYQP
jgi:hypothetical protein